MTAAQEAFLKDLQAAGGESEKVSLANNRLRWAEEAAKEAFLHQSMLYKFFESIPVAGKPIAIILDIMEKAIAEHGIILGGAKGLLIGIIIAALLIVASEAVLAGFEVVRQGVTLEWTAPMGAEQRTHAVEQNLVLEQQRMFHRGQPAKTQGALAYYAFDDMKANAHIVDGSSLTAEELEALDPGVLHRASHIVDSGVVLSPFFHYFETSNVYLLDIKTPIVKAAHHDVATITDPETGTQYVVAAGPDDLLILVALGDYQAAHLPMHEDIE
ncbi:MAG TPA: hypothetical protein VGG72_20050 [Bryobacteraceae bacterium]|jgi:hypothetical protein